MPKPIKSIHINEDDWESLQKIKLEMRVNRLADVIQYLLKNRIIEDDENK
jgi:predicted CopG family antitoxin